MPDVTNKSIVVGECREIPVSVAIGDNQASILGAIGDNTSAVLVNIGTDSQFSAVCEYREVVGDTELRPFIEGKIK